VSIGDAAYRTRRLLLKEHAMNPLVVAVIFGLLVVVPMWRTVLSALILDKAPEKWGQW
jgi:hypothetical protein